MVKDGGKEGKQRRIGDMHSIYEDSAIVDREGSVGVRVGIGKGKEERIGNYTQIFFFSFSLLGENLVLLFSFSVNVMQSKRDYTNNMLYINTYLRLKSTGIIRSAFKVILH